MTETSGPAATSATGKEIEVAAVRRGEELDWPKLEAYLRDHVDGLDGPFSVLQFPNGSANLTYLVRIGDTELVVRRPPFGRLAPGAPPVLAAPPPPFGRLAPGAHDMRREFRAVDALGRHFDRVAKAYAFC